MTKEELKESIMLIEENAEKLRQYLREKEEYYEADYSLYVTAKNELKVDFTNLKELITL